MAMVRAALAGLLLGVLMDRLFAGVEAHSLVLVAALCAVLFGPEALEWLRSRDNP